MPKRVIKKHAQVLAAMRVHALFEGAITIVDAAEMTGIDQRQLRRIAVEKGLNFYRENRKETYERNRDVEDLFDQLNFEE